MNVNIVLILSSKKFTNFFLFIILMNQNIFLLKANVPSFSLNFDKNRFIEYYSDPRFDYRGPLSFAAKGITKLGNASQGYMESVFNPLDIAIAYAGYYSLSNWIVKLYNYIRGDKLNKPTFPWGRMTFAAWMVILKPIINAHHSYNAWGRTETGQSKAKGIVEGIELLDAAQ